MSSMVAPEGMLMVLEMAPETKGCTAAIISMCAFHWMKRFPIFPFGEAVSNTA
jgi:hypothetical protein